MTELEKALNHIAEQIKRYRKMDPNDGNGMSEVMQQISATLYFLETERAKYHNNFQVLINQFVLNGDSVARAENKANVQVPEMYMLRRIMDSAYTCIDSIRTQVSWIKSGLQ